MIDGKTILAVIPARGGSKGIPRKNILDVAGKPLIAWTIEAYIDRLILSSDDPEIIGIAKSQSCEVPFTRPSELAQDDTPGVEPVLHAIKSLPGYDYVVLLQPTSPLRTSTDIDNSLEECLKRKSSACVSVVESEQNPYWMFLIDESQYLKPLLSNEIFSRRQDLPKVYIPNGAIYIANCDWLLKSQSFIGKETIPFIMPQERSLDIDSHKDIDSLTARLNSSGTS